MFRLNKAAICCLCAFLVITLIYTGASGGEANVSENNEVVNAQYEINTNRHTLFVESPAVENRFSTDNFQKKLESDILEVWYSEESTSIRVVDKRSGYIWGCTQEEQPENLNKKWHAKANSLCTITYVNKETNKEEEVALSESTLRKEVLWSDNSALFKVSGRRIGISFEIFMELDGDRLIIGIDDGTVAEEKENLLKSVIFLNFFGSTEQDSVPGYFLIPDGCGALMRFRESRAYTSGFEKKVYGSDFGVDKVAEQMNLNGNRTDDYATPANQVILPLYGIVHGENQNGILAVIENGAEYASISAVPSGVSNIDYNRAYITFNYRQFYDKRVSKSRTVTVPQEELNQIDAELSFRFLSGEEANYSGMALRYSEKLLEENIIAKKENNREKIPVLINIMGSEVKKGFLRNSLSVLTTAKQAMNISSLLAKSGIDIQTLLFSGGLSGGYSGSSYGTVRFEKKVGSSEEFKALSDYVKKNGGDFALSLRVSTANKDQINISSQAALTRSKDSALYEIPNETLMYPAEYYIKPPLITEYVDKINNELPAYSVNFEDLGYLLYSDYTRNRQISRKQSKELLTDAFEKIGLKAYFSSANEYMLPYTKAVTSIPVTNSQYMYETDTVPFLQMILKGRIDYYAPYSNQGFYSDLSVLKMIEYGAYPSFILMEADNFEIYNTPIQNMFSLNFENWEENIKDIYHRVNKVLAQVEDCQILFHRTIMDGVAAVGYSNGKTIYINYNETAVKLDESLTIPEYNCAVGDTGNAF